MTDLTTTVESNGEAPAPIVEGEERREGAVVRGGEAGRETGGRL